MIAPYFFDDDEQIYLVHGNTKIYLTELDTGLSGLDDCRIRRAKELLQNTDLMIREVAIKVGYEAAQSFTRLFKKLTGMTPQGYRESQVIR